MTAALLDPVSATLMWAGVCALGLIAAAAIAMAG